MFRFALFIFLLAGCGQTFGSIDLPHGTDDAGSVGLQAGETIPVRWENAPPDAQFYAFIWVGNFPALMGIDTNATDGIAIEWRVPEYISGKPIGIALFADGTWRISRITSLDYSSGHAPPEGVCVVDYSSNAPEVFDNLPNAGAYRILGYLRDYAPVLEIVDDDEGFRWFRVDLSQPSVINPLDGVSDLPETAWVYGIAALVGDCSELQE